MKKLTTEEFIIKSQKVHNNKYIYTNTIYKNANSKVKVYCKKHNYDFIVTAKHHLCGQGCPRCAKNLKTQEDFISESIHIHDNKYDYSKVEYKDSHTKVCIICPEHGEFWQMPNSHLKGYGCQKCALGVFDKETFIQRSMKIHNNKYDYSKVDYIDTHTKVKIVCPIHGEFEQVAYSHLEGRGCRKCGEIQTVLKTSKKTDDFIKKANEIHSNKYNYSKVKYQNNYTPITIICKKHGEFKQQPYVHLRGSNCPYCISSRLEDSIRKLLLKNNINFIFQANKKLFEWLDKQSLDFYLPDYNIAIECQGEQHFKNNCFFNDNDSFEKTLQRDLLKIKRCSENNIKLIHFADQTVNIPEKWSYYSVIRDLNKLYNIITEEEV